uniref:Uncharacterized protein n=1 Tax=Sinocyclocheilus anshuiensis TaxID=1608454 RepID=A0A671M9M5_9TELE
ITSTTFTPMADSDSTSTSHRKPHCPHTPVSLSLPFLREGSNVLERKPPQTGEPPSPLPTKRTRTYSAIWTYFYYFIPIRAKEMCPVPPKNIKFQAVDVVITNLSSGRKHETWSGQVISS